jgi:hypothetical protein
MLKTGSSGRRLALLAVGGLLLFATAGSSADTFAVNLVSQDATTITLGWSPQPGYGYLFSKDGKLVSRTYDANRSMVRFSKATSYDIDVIVKGDNGHYPPAPPPPPKAQCEDAADNDGDGKVDYPADPGCSNATDNDETDPVVPGGNLFVTTSGNDSSACSQSAPCQTWNRAYQVAQCGDTVSVAAGTYSDQTFVERAALSGCSTNVLFQAAPGVTVNDDVVLGTGFFNNADHITLRGFKYTGSIVMNGDADHILVEAVDGGSVHIDNGASFVTVRNSDFGPCNSPAGPAPQCERFFILDASKDTNGGDSCGCVTHDILIDHNTIHDYEITNPDHWEALFATGGTNVTIRGNKFYDNEIYHISIGENAYGNFNGWTIENNWFGRVCNSCESGTLRNSAVKFGGRETIDNILVRYNSFTPGAAIVNEDAGNVTLNNVRSVGNIIGSAQSTDCNGAGSFDSNVFINSGNGQGCGTNKRVIQSAPYVNASPSAAMDYHLLSGTGLEGFVTSTSSDASLGFDYDGSQRVNPRTPGSDER